MCADSIVFSTVWCREHRIKVSCRVQNALLESYYMFLLPKHPYGDWLKLPDTARTLPVVVKNSAIAAKPVL